MILELVLRAAPFQTREDLLGRLYTALQSRVHAKGEDLVVLALDAIRDFNGFLAPIGITPHNAFVSREGMAAPHAFSFKLRQDLSRREAGMLSGRGTRAEPQDVLCVYKTWMHSREIKAHVLVLPLCRAQAVIARTPTNFVLQTPLDNKRKQELTNFAEVLRRSQYSLLEAADAVDKLTQEPPAYTLPLTPWFERDSTAPTAVLQDTGSELFAHLPDTSWDLLATYHRQQ